MNWEWSRRFQPKATVEVLEDADGLAIRSRVDSHLFTLFIPIAIGSGVILWGIHAHWNRSFLAFVAISAAISTWNNWEPVDVHLLVTTKGFESLGNFGGGYVPVRQLLWSDVTRLEYRSGSGGEDDTSPSGIWAVGPQVTTCLLPGLDETETAPIIERIYQRFAEAEMAVDVGYSGLFKTQFISLGLNQND